MSIDLEGMSLTEIIRLQNQLSQVLARKFEKPLSLAFSDIVGSTPYFARFGDLAGRKLQQRHIDRLQSLLPAKDGRLVDTAGDGAFTCFPSVDAAVDTMVALLEGTLEENASLPIEHHLNLRIGIHWGVVLTDGVIVSGDAVNLCSRVTATARQAQVHLTREAFQELSTGARRMRCQPVGPFELKGIERQVELMRLDWQDRNLFPSHVEILETGERIELPDQPLVSFGRLDMKDGVRANDVVLRLPDPEKARQISRWHFELRRQPSGMTLKAVSNQITEVDGRPIALGEQENVRAGTVVRVAGVMTLQFVGETHEEEFATTFLG